MLTRRTFLKLAGVAPVGALACRPSEPVDPLVLDDVHSKLNATRVAEIAAPRSTEELAELVSRAARTGQAISIAGGRHSMGGQQFGAGTLHIDTRGLNRMRYLAAREGIARFEAGIQWPQVVQATVAAQRDAERPWGIVQKQTGADRMTLGGAVAANVHGRGLSLPPFVGDVEELTLVGPNGDLHRCSRSENRDLFELVIGGYGLFGLVTEVELRLAPRRKIERVVEVRSVDGLDRAFEDRIEEGFLYGDFQFKTDEAAPDFLESGVFSCYRPVDSDLRIPKRQRRLSRMAWRKLLDMAHFDKTAAWERYSEYYLKTDGQLYWSDSHQLSTYLDDYHEILDRKVRAETRGTEMITEIYVPRTGLAQFMGEAADLFRSNGSNVIYGTVRLIEPDDVTFLRWARERFACIVFNLHVDHTPGGIELAKGRFRDLIDLAIRSGGSFFLTYHRWATREQIEACYPEMPEFLSRKLDMDPNERFQSDWYRHYREMFRDAL